MDYAILKLGVLLDLKQFGNEEDWRAALLTYRERNILVIALKYHHGAAQWTQVEVVI